MDTQEDLFPDSNDGEIFIPPAIRAKVAKAKEKMYPKSKEKYFKSYERFNKWRVENHVQGQLSVDIFLAYFEDLSELLSAISLWPHYSMLRSVIEKKHNINIHDYSPLIALLKQLNKGYEPKKAKTLEGEDVARFLKTAPDEHWIDVKCATVFGLAGAGRCEELKSVKVDDIKDNGLNAIVHIRKTKNGVPRKFALTGPFYGIYRRYKSKRPARTESKRFFLTLRNGKCTQQPIGINKFGGMPKRIACFLGLPNPDAYTGHAFRRTSATLLAESGADLLTLKRHGGWKSSKIAEGYVDDTERLKKKVSDQIVHMVIPETQSPPSSPQPRSPSTNSSPPPRITSATSTSSPKESFETSYVAPSTSTGFHSNNQRLNISAPINASYKRQRLLEEVNFVNQETTQCNQALAITKAPVTSVKVTVPRFPSTNSSPPPRIASATSTPSPKESFETSHVAPSTSTGFHSNNQRLNISAPINASYKRQRLLEEVNFVNQETTHCNQAPAITKAPVTSVRVTVDDKENVNMANLMRDVLPGGNYHFSFTNCQNIILHF